MVSRKRKEYHEYPLRTCYSSHECSICNGEIIAGEKYYDGGYGRRGHKWCVAQDTPKKLIAKIECKHTNNEKKTVMDFPFFVCLDCGYQWKL